MDETHEPANTNLNYDPPPRGGVERPKGSENWTKFKKLNLIQKIELSSENWTNSPPFVEGEDPILQPPPSSRGW